ncbi:MAG: adenylate cyclase [Thermoleophilaceae bacterium]|nr:adenylate cyclase [Thermoleophilaceae bacterium]
MSLDELREAIEEHRLTLLPVDQVLGGGGKYALSEVADRADLPLDFLGKQRQALGLPAPDPGEKLFSDEDLEAARDLKRLLDAGIPPDAIHDTARVMGEALARVANASRQVVGRALIRPGDTERGLGLRYAEATTALVPVMAKQLEYVYRVHLREQLRNTMLDQATLDSGELPGSQEVTVCFADLVGFTKLGEGVAPEELGGVVGKLTEMAGEVAESPVRLVKTIGDAAMIVGPEPVPVVNAALRLVEMAEDAGRDFPSIRSGVASGAALERAGDYYGSPVNVASRVTGVARPASVLVTGDVHDAAEDDFRWSSAGRRKLKGVSGQVPLFRARPKGSDESD